MKRKKEMAITTWKVMVMLLKSLNRSYNRTQALHTLQPALVLPIRLNVQCSLITQYMDMALLRTAFRTIIQSSKAIKWVRKQTLLVNLWESSKKDRTDQSAYQVFDSQQSRCRCRCTWVLSIFLVKIKLPSLILQQWKSWGEKSNCTKGVSNSQKKGEAPFHLL